MKKILVVILILSIVGMTALVSHGRNESVVSSPQITEKQPDVLAKTKTKQAGAVNIEATPVQLEPGKEAVIELSLNTHSVELGYDYTEISYLEDNLGNKYKALKWSGEKGGHHLGGTLTFAKLQQNAKSVVLKISKIDDQDVFFEWEL